VFQAERGAVFAGRLVRFPDDFVEADASTMKRVVSVVRRQRVLGSVQFEAGI
jgi:hypothetical protein